MSAFGQRRLSIKNNVFVYVIKTLAELVNFRHQFGAIQKLRHAPGGGGVRVTHSVTQCDNGEGESAIALCHTCHLYSTCYHVVRFAFIARLDAGQTMRILGIASFYCCWALKPAKMTHLLQQAAALRIPESGDWSSGPWYGMV